MQETPISPALALLALIPGLVWASAEPLDEAESAYNAGRTDEAIQICEEALADDPEELRLLLGCARLLSWENRLQASIAAYDRALELDPQNRDAALARGIVLSWDGRLDASVAQLEALRERDLEDREVRLALARVLSWKGEFTQSWWHYDRLLARNRDDLDATLGTARVLAYSGDLAASQSWYQRALELDPENKDARVGLAYVELWGGAPDSASTSLTQLRDGYPEDRDIRALDRSVRGALAPTVRVDASRTEDTDDNILNRVSIDGGWHLGRRGSLDAGVAHFDMEDPIGEATIDNVHVAYQTRPARYQMVRVHAGYDHRTETTGETDGDLLGGVTWMGGLDRRWQYRAAIARDAVRYSPLITDNGIVFDGLHASASGALGDRWRLDFAAGGASFSDDNERVNAIAAASYGWPISRMRLSTGLVLRYMDYKTNTASGYFDPQDFTSALARVRGGGQYGKRKNTYAFQLDLGVQSFTQFDFEVDNDFVYVVSATLGFPIGKGFALELHGNQGDYAAQNATGFESREYGLRLRWRGGP